MTTVVATRAALYSDSKCTYGDTYYHSRKLHRVGDSILGVCGTPTDSRKFLKWFESKSKEDTPEFTGEDTFTVLEVSPSGIFKWDSALTPIEVLSPHMVVGSGYMAASAALYLGVSPERAIEAACAVDNHSSGPLQVLHLV